MRESPFKGLFMWVILTIGYYALAVALGVDGMEDFTDYMLGGFRDYWAVHGDTLTPNWLNPFLLMLAAIALWVGKLKLLINVSRAITGLIGGVFLVRVPVYLLDLYPMSMSALYIALGVFSLVWYVATSLLVSDKFHALIERLRAD